MAAISPYYATNLAPTSQNSGITAGATGGDTHKGCQRMVLLAKNTHATTAYSASITGQQDHYGRTASVTMSITAGSYAAIMLPSQGFLDTGGDLNTAVENTAVKYQLINFPR